MRRGASVSETRKRYPVEADANGDVEGGGLLSPSSGGGPASAPMPPRSSPFLARSGSSFGADGSSSSRLELSGGGALDPLLVSPSPMASHMYDAKDKRRGGSYAAFSRNGSHHTTSQDQIRWYSLGLLVGTCILFPMFSVSSSILLLVTSSCVFGLLASWWLSKSVLSVDEGTMEMRAVSDPIREGATGFLRVQYSAIAKISIPLALLILGSYQLRPTGVAHSTGVAVLGNSVLGIVAAISFLAGASASALAGYMSMCIAAQTNIRVASASRRSYSEALVVCFRGGAFSAVLNLTLCIAGVTALYCVLSFLFVTNGNSIEATDIPMLCVGFGFGASFVALFMQLGGGIYTKAADVGADLVGKVEQSIPEDDPRNPATIADLVGDMVSGPRSIDPFDSLFASHLVIAPRWETVPARVVICSRVLPLKLLVP
jgi:Inorganic H+ pyrophosphatase